MSLYHLLSRATDSNAGVFSGVDPTEVNPGNPLTLFIIQACLIILLSQGLAIGFAKIRQPKVIAEVIGGILLGPTALGRIPNFTAHIFPPASLPALSLVANLGLVLFLFLVGLEVDLRIFKRNARASAVISFVGLVIPFGCGALIAIGLWNAFPHGETVKFSYFLLFLAVSLAITAFPVLCRILTELKLMETNVGVVVLAAGVGNDVVGWILLAVAVALANAGSGVHAVYILLCCIGWILVLVFAVRPLFLIIARRSGSLNGDGPTQAVVTIALLLVLASAFLTDILGVHAIFGAFLVGVIMPHEGGFAIHMTEKIEDLVSICLLPLFFASSGLKTDLGLLNSGLIWGYSVLVIIVAFLSKFGPCLLAARVFGFNWRESSAIGCLMSCKGLVELIVLNIGRNSGILSDQVFALMVLMAVVTTLMTTPLTLWAYPPKHRTVASATRDGTDDKLSSRDENKPGPHGSRENTQRYMLVLSKISDMPALIQFIQLLVMPTAPEASLSVEHKVSRKSKDADRSLSTSSHEPLHQENTVKIETLRLLELTDRTASVMMGQDVEDTLKMDPVVSIFKTISGINRLSFNAALSVVNYNNFATSITNHATETKSEMIILPWSSSSGLEFGILQDESTTAIHSPIENIFGSSAEGNSPAYSHVIRGVFGRATTDVAVFVDRGLAVNGWAGHHIFLPFFGNADDRTALSLVMQLCRHPGVSATILRAKKLISEGDSNLPPVSAYPLPVPPTAYPYSAPPSAISLNRDDAVAPGSDRFATIRTASDLHGLDTANVQQSTMVKAASDVADNMIWEYYSTPPTNLDASSAFHRVKFEELESQTPLTQSLKYYTTLIESSPHKSYLVVAGRGRKAASSTRNEMSTILSSSSQQVDGNIRKTLGDVALSFLISPTKGNMLVVQAAKEST